MELISKDDAIAVAMYSKDPVEGIKNLPTVDPAAEVVRCLVRCKDCKWYAPNNGGSWLGCAFDTRHPDDVPKAEDFCSYGERKDLVV